MSNSNPGDIVQLNSGGPAMTINSIDDDNGRLLCLWFDDAGRHEAQFPPETVHPLDASK